MSAFLTPLEVEEVSDTAAEGRGLWRLTAPLVYYSEYTGDTNTVQKGYVTDFNSCPRFPIIFLLCGAVANKPSCWHDWAYTADPKTGKHPYDRATADWVLKEAALSEGVPAWRCWLLWAGVRIGGASHWA